MSERSSDPPPPHRGFAAPSRTTRLRAHGMPGYGGQAGRPDDRLPVVVTAAVIERHGAYLVTRRPQGVHLEGCWEFPGGKCDPGESHQACLRREIREELGTGVEIGEEIFGVAYDYPDRTVELHFFQCVLVGEPRPLLGQEMRWVPRGELHTLDFPPADAGLVERLQRAGDASVWDTNGSADTRA